MSMSKTRGSRPNLRNLGFHAPRRGPTRSRPHGIRPGIDPGRSPGTAPLLRFLGRDECIAGVLGPTEADHFFKFRVDSDAILSLALASTGSVAGLQVIRSPDGQGNGGGPVDILTTTSTLVTDPATLDVILGAGLYLVRVYGFFQDSADYLLELSLCSPGRASVLLCPAASNSGANRDHEPVPATDHAASPTAEHAARPGGDELAGPPRDDSEQDPRRAFGSPRYLEAIR
jgi:hypothetical protein